MIGKILLICLKTLSFFVWVVFVQLMTIITSKNSLITAESMNNRKLLENKKRVRRNKK